MRPDAPLPTPLQILAWEGEAHARLRFKALFAEYQFFDEDKSLISLWHSIAVKEGLLFDLLGKAGLYSALSTECKLPIPTPAMSVQLYFALLGTLYDSKNPKLNHHLLGLITDAFWKYHFCQLYPSKPYTSQKTSLSILRQKLQKALQIHCSLPIELRERFNTAAQQATFTLRWRTVLHKEYGTWHEEPTLTGTKLKPLKRQAYEDAIALYQSLQRSEA